MDTFLVQPVKKSSPERLASLQGPGLDSTSRRELRALAPFASQLVPSVSREEAMARAYPNRPNPEQRGGPKEEQKSKVPPGRTLAGKTKGRVKVKRRGSVGTEGKASPPARA